MLYGGSTSQLNGAGNLYLPDYSVRQLTHLQVIKVTYTTYTGPRRRAGRGVTVLNVALRWLRSRGATTRTR